MQTFKGGKNISQFNSPPTEKSTHFRNEFYNTDFYKYFKLKVEKLNANKLFH